MVDFICMIEHQQVPENQIPDQFRSSFVELKTDVNDVVGSMACSRHRSHPVVVLNWTAGRARLIGLRPCCEEFGKSLRDTIDQSKLGVSNESRVVNPDGSVTLTRSKWYTSWHLRS